MRFNSFLKIQISNNYEVDTAKIFISYRREDSQYLVRPITRWLRRRYGRTSVFIDIEAIAVGEDFNARINNEIQQSDVVLALVGPGWASAMHRTGENWVRDELLAAHLHDKPVIPVLHNGQAMPTASDLPRELEWFTHRNAYPLGTPSELRQDLKNLTKKISEQIDLPTFKLVLWRTYRSSRTALKATAIGVAALAFIVLAYQFLQPDASNTEITYTPTSQQLSDDGASNIGVAEAPITAVTPNTAASVSSSPAATTSTATTTTTSTTTSTTLSTTTTVASTTTSPLPRTPTNTVLIAASSRYGEDCQISTAQRLTCQSGVRLNGVTGVELGRFHSCALTQRGEVWCWTLDDREGDFRKGWNPANPFIPVQVVLPGRATDISIGTDGFGDAFTCAVLASSEVRCWGANSAGQLGFDPAESDVNSITVPEVTGAVRIATGNGVTCSLASSGSVSCWGMISDEFYRLEVPAPLKFTDVGACCGVDGQPWFFALADDGSVWVWRWDGDLEFGSLMGLQSDRAAVAVAGSFDRVCAITEAGEVICAQPHVGAAFTDVLTAFDDTATAISAQSLGTVIAVTDSQSQLWDLLKGSEPIEALDPN